MAVGRLKTVLVADDDEVAVAAGPVGDADLAGKGGPDRIAGLERQVAALMAAFVTVAELGEDFNLVGAAEVGGIVDQPESHFVRKGLEVDPVGVHGLVVPVLGEIVFLLETVSVLDIFPGIVAIEYELYKGVGGVKGVDGSGIAGNHRPNGLEERPGNDELRLGFGELGTLRDILLHGSHLRVGGRPGQQEHHCQCFS